MATGVSKSAIVCALCLRERPIVVSHLLSSGFYRLLRDPSHRNPHPIVVNQVTSVQTASQIEAPLLCVECEQRLNNGGERWVLQNCFREPGQFRLLESLLAAKPLGALDDGFVYAGGRIAEINMDALVHFAASTVWRAAARRWPGEGLNEGLCLGPYADAFRQYLSGDAAFPEQAATWINVWRKPVKLCVMPRTIPANGYRHHHFTVPGVSFHVFVGKRMPSAFLSGCAARSPDRVLMLSDEMNAPLMEGIARMTLGSRGVGALRERTEMLPSGPST